MVRPEQERLILTNQAKIHPGPLLTGALLIAKIPHLRIKPVIPGRQLGILFPLLGNRLLQGPHLRKTALPDPQANLQQEYQHYQNGPKRFHAESVQKMNNNINESRVKYRPYSRLATIFCKSLYKKAIVSEFSFRTRWP